MELTLSVIKDKKISRALCISLILLFLILGAVFSFSCRKQEEIPEETIPPIVEETIVQEEEAEEEEEEEIDVRLVTGNINLLSGLEISGSVQNARPLAIMVQNSPAARPHSGLIYADIVFEAVSEAGVTRFVTFYSSYDADIIGPARSARIYFAEIARAFDSIFTFWGTYPEGYTAIQQMGMDVLDANSTAYVAHTTAGWREPTRASALEHTAFIDTHGIKEDSKSLGYPLEGGQSAMVFKYDADASLRGNIDEIIVDFSTKQYEAGFYYDPQSNAYLKTLAGEAHKDFETDQQILLNNVVVLITDIEGPLSTAGHMMVKTTADPEKSKAFYFMDGNVIEGSWGRKTIFDPFAFYDENGDDVLFNRGSTWVCFVQGVDRVLF